MREAKRKKLEADRLVRAQQRAARQKQLQQLEQSQKEADEALREFCELADDIFEDEPGIDNDVSEDILEDFIMTNFDQENDDNLGSKPEIVEVLDFSPDLHQKE